MYFTRFITDDIHVLSVSGNLSNSSRFRSQKRQALNALKFPLNSHAFKLSDKKMPDPLLLLKMYISSSLHNVKLTLFFFNMFL